jgi:hypothetical protein
MVLALSLQDLLAYSMLRLRVFCSFDSLRAYGVSVHIWIMRKRFDEGEWMDNRLCNLVVRIVVAQV